MVIVLFIFGCGIGTVDVAMNAHGVQVQNLYGRPIMSSLHGLFSVGGLLGPLGIGFLMKSGLNPYMQPLQLLYY
jgi:fucose permease